MRMLNEQAPDAAMTGLFDDVSHWRRASDVWRSAYE
jgi:hypothetical protein